MEELVVDAALAAVAQGRLQSRNRQVCTLLEGQAEPLGTLTVRFLVGQAEAAEYSRVTRVWRGVSSCLYAHAHPLVASLRHTPDTLLT